MNGGADPLLDHSYGTFDLPNVAVRWNNVKVNGANVGTEALKLVVSVNVTDSETSGMVQLYDRAGFI